MKKKSVNDDEEIIKNKDSKEHKKKLINIYENKINIGNSRKADKEAKNEIRK